MGWAAAALMAVEDEAAAFWPLATAGEDKGAAALSSVAVVFRMSTLSCSVGVPSTIVDKEVGSVVVGAVVVVVSVDVAADIVVAVDAVRFDVDV